MKLYRQPNEFALCDEKRGIRNDFEPSSFSSAIGVGSVTAMSSIQIAAEDRFLIVDMTPTNELFVDAQVFENFIEAAARLTDWEVLFDFRSPELAHYNDILESFGVAKQALEWAGREPVALVSPDGWEPFFGCKTVKMRQRSLPQREIDAEIFDGDQSWVAAAEAILFQGHESFVKTAADLGVEGKTHVNEWRSGMDSVAERAYYSRPALPVGVGEGRYDAIEIGMVEDGRAAYLDSILRGFACNSTLIEVAIQVDSDGAQVIPYHAHSLHEVSSKLTSDVVHLRPGRVSGNYVRRFRTQIEELERLIAKPNVRESEIQALLDDNPLFLESLNYGSVYTNVVLDGPGKPTLKPDIIAEPASEEWAHIIDLKLPSAKIFAGRPNRAKLAGRIWDVAAQLREYGAFFDDRDVAQQVEERYGFKCYKPKLVAIMGRDPSEYSEEERRRVMSSQSDLEIVTYDRLIRAAKHALLF